MSHVDKVLSLMNDGRSRCAREISTQSGLTMKETLSALTNAYRQKYLFRVRAFSTGHERWKYSYKLV